MVETAVDVIITMNTRGIVQSANSALTDLLGYKPEELIGQNIKMLMPEKYSTKHDGYLQHYADTGDRKVIGIGRFCKAIPNLGNIFQSYYPS